jgi:hypothetical protein
MVHHGCAYRFYVTFFFVLGLHGKDDHYVNRDGDVLGYDVV